MPATAAAVAALLDGGAITTMERDVVVAQGPDAVRFLQGQLSQDVAGMSPGAAALSFLLEPQFGPFVHLANALGFGGTGAHYCVGANLARMTINLMFGALADAVPDLAALAEPERLRSGWLNGIKHWQVDYTRSSSV